jgi:hypothetical protein
MNGMNLAKVLGTNQNSSSRGLSQFYGENHGCVFDTLSGLHYTLAVLDSQRAEYDR